MLDSVIFNYRLTKKIGEGGMAKVYLGIHEQLETPAAIKVLDSAFVSNETVRQRFINEAKALYKLSHPYIVRLLNYEDNGKQLIMILDFIDGVDLKEHIQLHPEIKSPDVAITFFQKVLEAFSFAHGQGVVHRDIKPSNIMVKKDGTPIILDFGIAKLQDNLELSLTGTNALMGSRLYMSPEQVKSAKHLDHRSDIYSLGVTLYQLLTGQRVYDTTTLSEWDVMNKIVSEPLPRASQFNSEVTPRLEAIIDKATAKDLEQRFQSCEEFSSALSDVDNFPLPILGDDTVIETNPKNSEATVIEERPSLQKSVEVKEEKKAIPVTKGDGDNNKKIIIGVAVGIIVLLSTVFVVFSGVDEKTSSSETISEAVPAKTEEAKVETTKPQLSKEELLKQQDKEAYDTARKKNTVSAYQAYLKEYPQGNYVKDAKGRISALRAAYAKAKDKKAWDKARKTNTISAYKSYLANYKKGKYRTNAEQAIIDLEMAIGEAEIDNELEEVVEEIFEIVEDPAAYPGGMGQFYKWVGQNMKYPSQAKRMGVEGKVYVQFVVDKDGSLTDVRVVRGIGAGCDEEAVRVIRKAPKWKPGTQRGRKVKQRMVLPISFKLG
ncbi:TonB family protein [Flammeovirga sp. SubArs3]|uniref:TonB family protein n=1 Tax=Flammeovirga sp. SubArs3 TaxID=2995316 RepID=UPI0032B268C3